MITRRAAGKGRTVVFGEYPPTPGPAAAATLATVRDLVAGGRTVEVVSPVPSAAHHHADPRGLRGSVALARRTAGADALVAHLDPFLLLADPDRPRQAPARRALGLALGRAGRSTVHVGTFGGRLDPEIVRFVLGGADRVVAASPANAADLVSAGLAPQRVEVGSRSEKEPLAAAAGSPPPVAEAVGPRGRREPWSLEPGCGRHALEEEIRRRAAADRSSERGGAGAVPAPEVAGPLRHLLPLTPVPTRSRRPIFGVVKRFVRRLVAWQIDPVIDHVNLLHRAAIDAVEARPGSASTPGGLNSASTAGGPGSASTAGGLNSASTAGGLNSASTAGGPGTAGSPEADGSDPVSS